MSYDLVGTAPEYDNLIQSNEPPFVRKTVTIASGAGSLVRGTLLGRITASGKCKTVNLTAGDGTETPYAVLLEDVDATSADAPAVVTLKGAFLGAGMTFDYDETADDWKTACEAVGIHIFESIDPDTGVRS